MNMDLVAEGDPDMGHMCYDYFSFEDITPEDYIGIAWTEQTEAGFAFLDQLAVHLHRDDCVLTHVDNGGSIVLLLHTDAWNDPMFQNTWKKLICLSKEQLIEQFNVRYHIDRDPIYQEWAEYDTGQRIRSLISHEVDDLALAIVDDLPDKVEEAIIEQQIESLLR